MARLGILGGTFNPPHLGHLVCAQEALVQLGLDEVLFVPFGRPSHRELPDDPGPEVRLELAELAVAEDDRIGVSRIEVDRPGPSYTADTLAELRERSPEDDLVLILGGDQAAALPSWHRPDEVLSLATPAIVERAEHRRTEIAERVRSVRGDDRAVFVDMPRCDVSSTLVRLRAAAGLPIRYLVPDRVAELVGGRNLYRSSAPVGAS